jgi:ABC-type uncharacterized transport system substrate-binding protein
MLVNINKTVFFEKIRYMCVSFLCSLFFFLSIALIVPYVAFAHPHVYVVARSTVVFGPGGKVVAIRHSWTFDDMYSAFAIEGLGTKDTPPTPEQLAPLAKTNVESLAEYGYFTTAKVGGKPLEFAEPNDQSMEANAQRIVTLHFTVPLKVPADVGRAFTFQVYDPTYFVSFDFDATTPITMADAPQGCSASIFKPKPLDTGDTQKLSESFFSGLSPGADFGIKLASRAVIA